MGYSTGAELKKYRLKKDKGINYALNKTYLIKATGKQYPKGYIYLSKHLIGKRVKLQLITNEDTTK